MLSGPTLKMFSTRLMPEPELSITKPSQDHGIPLPLCQREEGAGCEAARASGSQAVCPFTGAMPSRPGGVSQWEGGMWPLCPCVDRTRRAAGYQAASSLQPIPEPAETPGACLAHCSRGSTSPASFPQHPLKAPPKHT